jgi:hypothetical protein
MTKIHPTHRTSDKPLVKWYYCLKCGLVYLRNEVTSKAMRQGCEAKDD